MDDQGIEQDLEILAQQEHLLRFPAFSAEMSWSLGTELRRLAVQRGQPMSFEIQLAGRTLFACSTQDAPAGQADWIRRKRNTVLRFGRSTYALGRELERDGKTMEQRHGLALTDFAMHGGGFPIVLSGTGLVGAVVASGLPQREDHNLVIEALSQVFGISVPRLSV